MTRKEAIRIEKELKARGVYKPYATADKDYFFIESYPLTAVISNRSEVDPQDGPYQTVKITDCTRMREGLDTTVEITRSYLIGKVLIAHVAERLTALHPEAHARSIEQDNAAMNRSKTAA